jgi:23S rRNA pseudouridine1911/1915/1917 synthase
MIGMGGALQVLYEDNHFIAVNKRSSDIVQGDKSGDEPLSEKVREYIRGKYGKRGGVFVGVPHRLDRPTSGVVLFARTSKALERLSLLFREGGVAKKYWAMVQARPPRDQDTLVHYLTRNVERNKSYLSDRPAPGAQEARLSYRLLLSLDRYHLLEVEMQTGRHHQIRAQLASIGCPIKGDLKYGARRSNPGGGIHLHAREVSFMHPVKQVPVRITADPPPDPLWDEALRRLAGKAAGDGSEAPGGPAEGSPAEGSQPTDGSPAAGSQPTDGPPPA